MEPIYREVEIFDKSSGDLLSYVKYRMKVKEKYLILIKERCRNIVDFMREATSTPKEEGPWGISKEFDEVLESLGDLEEKVLDNEPIINIVTALYTHFRVFDKFALKCLKENKSLENYDIGAIIYNQGKLDSMLNKLEEERG